MPSQEEKIIELEKRVETLEREVLGKKQRVTRTPRTGQLALEDLKIPNDILATIRTRIRKIGYWNLILTLLYFAPQALTYSDLMNLSKEFKKPVSYDWLNTEFHRKKYSGLVRSESIPDLTEKTYSLTENGRKRS